MAEGIGKDQKKDIMKDIIRELHEGLSLMEIIWERWKYLKRSVALAK